MAAAPGPAAQYWDDVGLQKVVAGILLGPLAWLLDLEVSYALVKWTCQHDARMLLWMISAASLSLIAWSTWLSGSSWVRLRRRAREDGARVEDRSYFLAITGLATNALFALLILTSQVPRFVLSPCD
jgi:nicotinamide riboside transporter PnuC